jgi:glycosyltransferase involved in cell wall biosynthesis
MFEEWEVGFGRRWPRVFEALSGRVAGAVGVSPRLVARLDSAIQGPLATFEVLVATTQSIGMALAALKALGRCQKRVVIMTMGLLSPEAPSWKRGLFRWLLEGVDLAVLSQKEAASIRTWIGPGTHVHDFTFGVDLDFWTPGGAPGDVVLSIGNDPARDFATLIAAWQPTFPTLRIITSRPVASEKANVVIERGDWRSAALSDVDIRERFRRARLVVTPVTDTIQPSGQSATLQAMACGRPVIMTRNRGLWDVDFMNPTVCRLVPPGDSAVLSQVIQTMLDDREGTEAIGQAARRAMVDKDISSAAMARQIEALAS